MNNYGKLKKIIQEANPEIMELKFGCEILCEQVWADEIGNYHDEYGTVVFNELDKYPEEGLSAWVDSIQTLMPLGEPTKILGRPIRLADVLLAISNHIKKNKNIYFSAYFAYIDGKILWDLRQDNLDHQTEETKEFLINLLVLKQ